MRRRAQGAAADAGCRQQLHRRTQGAAANACCAAERRPQLRRLGEVEQDSNTDWDNVVSAIETRHLDRLGRVGEVEQDVACVHSRMRGAAVHAVGSGEDRLSGVYKSPGQGRQLPRGVLRGSGRGSAGPGTRLAETPV